MSIIEWSNGLKFAGHASSVTYFFEKLEWRALIQLHQVRTRITCVDRCQRTRVTTQPLKIIKRQAKKMRHSEFDWVCMKNNRHNIPRLGMLLNNLFQRTRNASLYFRK